MSLRRMNCGFVIDCHRTFRKTNSEVTAIKLSGYAGKRGNSRWRIRELFFLA